MINIIVCDDDIKYRQKVVGSINDFFNKNHLEYKVSEFDDYDNKFVKTMKSELVNKIYILDIETPTRSGIDVARIIRKEDVKSPIIFITGHAELGFNLLSRELNFISFINKFDSTTIRLNKSLKMAIKMLDHKQILKFNDRNSVYTINMDSILYITTDTVARKTIIVTDKNEYKVNNPLKYFLDVLDGNFIQSHKSCIINRNRLANANLNNNTIVFDNGLTIDLLSDKYKKDLIK